MAAKAAEADAIIFVGGLSSALEGEEMPVDLPGFKKGDRTNIDLPRVQEEMLKALKKTGKPVIFVVCSGSTLALPWEAENLDAMLEAWYPGQQGGTAVADVLFGDYNPAGRLPLTFYASDSDLPDFEDYNMSNRTYRYFKGKPLFPFGYGLSYTTFAYKNLQAVKELSTASESSNIYFEVTNTGKVRADEIAQVYLSPTQSNQQIHPIQLQGFTRISLNPGETKRVCIKFYTDQFGYYSHRGNRQWNIAPGTYELKIGASSQDIRLKQQIVLTGDKVVKPLRDHYFSEVIR